MLFGNSYLCICFSKNLKARKPLNCSFLGEAPRVLLQEPYLVTEPSVMDTFRESAQLTMILSAQSRAPGSHGEQRDPALLAAGDWARGEHRTRAGPMR